MVIDFIGLIFLVIVNILFIISIFNFTRANTKDSYKNAVITDVSELITFMIMIPFTINYILSSLMDGASLLLINIITVVLIICVWSIVRVPMIRDFLGIKIGIDSPTANNRLLNEVVNNTPKSESKSESKPEPESESKSEYKLDKDQVIFSKYIGTGKRNNFAFNELFPQYNNKNTATTLQTKDYSAFNGYPDEHICNGCSCIEGDDGEKFCGKYVPGMGTIGCSCRWECMNCKECGQHKCDNTETYQVTKEDDYECQNCKCHETSNGTICGKLDRIDGYVHTCKSSCNRCDKCYGADSSDLHSDAGMLTVDPYTKLNKVILNDISNEDLEKLL